MSRYENDKITRDGAEEITQPLIDVGEKESDRLTRRPKPSSKILCIMSTIYGVPMLMLGILLTVIIQCLCWAILWPLFLIKPTTKIYVCGNVFRTCAVLSTFTLNPFWNIRVLSRPNNFQPNGHTLVMCNHLTQADPWIFSRAFWPWEFKWVFKGELLSIPIVGWALRMAHDIPLHFHKRTEAEKKEGVAVGSDVKKLMDTVYNMGYCYDIGTLVFPEGTRSKSGHMGPFKEGFFRFAIEHNWDILPAVSHKSQSLWPLGGLKFGYGRVDVKIGHPVSPLIGETPSELCFRVREIMSQMLESMPDYDPLYDLPQPHDADFQERGQGILGKV